MNTDRLLREVETRLARLGEADRQEVLDAVREEIARERRRVEPELTVEAEWDDGWKRRPARGPEAINRPAPPREHDRRGAEAAGEVVASTSRPSRQDPPGCCIIAERGVPDGQSTWGPCSWIPSQAVLDEVARQRCGHRGRRAVPGHPEPPVRSGRDPAPRRGRRIGLLYLKRPSDPFVRPAPRQGGGLLRGGAPSQGPGAGAGAPLRRPHGAGCRGRPAGVRRGAARRGRPRPPRRAQGRQLQGRAADPPGSAGPVVAAATGEGLAGSVGRPAPPDLAGRRRCSLRRRSRRWARRRSRDAGPPDTRAAQHERRVTSAPCLLDPDGRRRTIDCSRPTGRAPPLPIGTRPPARNELSP